MLIIFSGLPGCGKSSISSELAKQLNAIYLRIDTIEQTILNSGTAANTLGYFIAYAIAQDNINIGNTVITDSVNPLHLTRNTYRNIALSRGVPYLKVEVICSDITLHQERIEKRASNIDGLKLPDWNDVINRHYESWDRERLVIDSATLTINQSVDKIIKAIQSDFPTYNHN